MQLEIDVLKATLDVKDPGINRKTLSSREKAVIVYALRGKCSLPLLLNALKFPKSSYYYQSHRKTLEAKYQDVGKHIEEVFIDNNSCYGYRWVTAALNREGLIMSEKVVRRIMHDNKLVVKRRKARRIGVPLSMARMD